MPNLKYVWLKSFSHQMCKGFEIVRDSLLSVRFQNRKYLFCPIANRFTSDWAFLFSPFDLLYDSVNQLELTLIKRNSVARYIWNSSAIFCRHKQFRKLWCRWKNSIDRRDKKTLIWTFYLTKRHILNHFRYIFTITSYLIGVFIFATIVGQVGNVITNRNANRLEFERILDGAKTYMRHHRVRFPSHWAQNRCFI